MRTVGVAAPESADTASSLLVSAPHARLLTSKDAAPAEILKMAKIGLACGLDGIVCSVKEAAFLKKNIKNKFIAVTPGIRPAKTAADDQKRTATAAEAIKAGSDFLVIGRPILQAKDPKAATEEILKSIREKRV